MDEQVRLNYLTRYYYELQGLRLAPIYIASPLLLFYLKPPAFLNERESDIPGILALGIFVFEPFWYWLVSRDYRHRFGWLSPRANPRQKAISRWFSLFQLGFCICWFAFKSRWVVSYLLPLWMILLVCQPLVDSGNPKPRRIAYSIGGALVAASMIVSWIVNAGPTNWFCVSCVVMFVQAIRDHLLLLSLVTPPREGADA